MFARLTAMNKFPDDLVQDDAMSEKFPIEFVGGSQDGVIVEATAAPEFCEVSVSAGIKEIYKRENDEPPFIYVQVGYAGNETWK